MKKINDLENLAKKYRRELFEKLLIIKQGAPWFYLFNDGNRRYFISLWFCEI